MSDSLFLLRQVWRLPFPCLAGSSPFHAPSSHQPPRPPLSNIQLGLPFWGVLPQTSPPLNFHHLPPQQTPSSLASCSSACPAPHLAPRSPRGMWRHELNRPDPRSFYPGSAPNMSGAPAAGLLTWIVPRQSPWGNSKLQETQNCPAVHSQGTGNSGGQRACPHRDPRTRTAAS